MTRKDFFKTASVFAGCMALRNVWSDSYKIKANSSVFKGKAPKSLWKYSKEVYHYIKAGENIQCTTCPNKCILAPGDRGICRSIVYINNKLYNISYGNPGIILIDPIEKMPLYHYYPGTEAFSIAAGGCPLRCLNCHNWEISQSTPEELKIIELFPDKVVEKAKMSGCKIIDYNYSEPVAWFEYMYDTAKIAKANGIKNVWVTSGYIEENPLKKLIEVIDAANVDLKSFSNSIYSDLNAGKLQPVLNTLKILHKHNIWFEITCLLVPTYSDSINMIKDMCKWILDNIGDRYPVHFTRFNSAYKLKQLYPTPLATLETAYQVAKDAGIKYVFIGNVPGTHAQNTLCPKCGKILIERVGLKVITNNLKNGVCYNCHTKIEGRW